MKTSSRCLAALNRAAGREMTADEALDAFDRVQRLARDIAAGRAKVDDADVSTPEGVIRKAADMAAQELIAEKARQLRNTEMRVAILGERQAEINAMRGGGIDDVDALRRLIVNDADGKELARFDLSEDGSTNTSLIFVELYRGPQGDIKVKAIGEGWASGLSGLAGSLGVNLG